MAGEVTGTALGPSGPVNGATVDLWLASRTWPGGLPAAQGAAPPTGSPDYGPVTSGTAYGGPGAFTITGVTTGDYLIRVNTGGVNYWSQMISVVEDGDVVHKAGTETVTGAKTFSGGVTFSGAVTMNSGTLSVTALTGVLPVANGGTGSATQNFVDLTTGQTMAGTKQFSGTPIFQNGLTVSGGTITLPNGSIPTAAIAGFTAGFAGVDLGSTQTITGPKTAANDLTMLGSKIVGTQISSPSAPTITNVGAAGSTVYIYKVVTTTYDGRDSIPSDAGSTSTGNATLNGTNYNTASWSAVTGAASYTVLKWNGSAWQKLAGGVTGTSYNDQGGALSAYSLSTTNPGGEITQQSQTMTGDLTNTGGQYIGTALSTPPTPTVTPTGGSGAVAYSYAIVGVSVDGRDTVQSTAGSTATGVVFGSLTQSVYNLVQWTALSNVAGIRVIRTAGGTSQGQITTTLLPPNALSFKDTGLAASAYTAATSNPGGELQVTSTPSLTYSGLTGATAGARIVGGVGVAGPPTSGTFSVGDIAVDRIMGKEWTCISAGSPGTWANNGVKSAAVATLQSTATTTYTDLGTVGPAVTITSLTTVVVSLSAQMGNASQFNNSTMGFAVSGATTLAASDSNCILHKEPDTDVGTTGGSVSGTLFLPGLTGGSNTLTSKYHAGNGTANFQNRYLTAMALDS